MSFHNPPPSPSPRIKPPPSEVFRRGEDWVDIGDDCAATVKFQGLRVADVSVVGPDGWAHSYWRLTDQPVRRRGGFLWLRVIVTQPAPLNEQIKRAIAELKAEAIAAAEARADLLDRSEQLMKSIAADEDGAA